MTDLDALRAAQLLHYSSAGLNKGDPVATPLVQSTMFHLPGDPAGFDQYGRYDNPTWEAAQDALALLEDAPALLFPSGMAAIAAVCYALLKSGDRILLPSDGYFAARKLAERFLAPMGITADTCPTAELAAKPLGPYALVLAESPSNPGLDVCDIAALAQSAKVSGALLAIDNTTMTPFGQRPLDLGAEIVVSADTKAMNGHSDLLAGHVASRNEHLMQTIAEWRKFAGAIPAPHDAWLLARGMATLEVRFERMCETASMVARRLADHPALSAIRFPGLKSDRSHETASRQMSRYGFLIGLTLPTQKAADHFIEACPLIQPATSFGGVHTSAERRARWGDAVAPGFVRLSIGCEPADILWEAIDDALKDT